MRDCNIIHLIKDDLKHSSAKLEALMSIPHNLSFPFVIGLARTSDTFANYWFATVFSEIFPDLIDASAGDFNILCYFS